MTDHHHPSSPHVREERPHRRLLTYYALSSLVLGPFFFFLLIPLFLRFRTLRYRFDDEGVSMSWGAMFRREVHLTYGRIQDIHLTSNVVERWLGLGRVEVQTASGSSKAEMVIEGLLDFEEIRDLLYRRMQRAGGSDETVESQAPSAQVAGRRTDGIALDRRTVGELALALRQVTAELEAVRHALETSDTRKTEP
jgi:putative membrane protein